MGAFVFTVINDVTGSDSLISFPTPSMTVYSLFVELLFVTTIAVAIPATTMTATNAIAMIFLSIAIIFTYWIIYPIEAK